MRKVNSVTKPIFFPLPLLEDVVHNLAEKNLTTFSVVDMTSGFWQIKLVEKSKATLSPRTDVGMARLHSTLSTVAQRSPMLSAGSVSGQPHSN